MTRPPRDPRATGDAPTRSARRSPRALFLASASCCRGAGVRPSSRSRRLPSPLQCCQSPCCAAAPSPSLRHWPDPEDLPRSLPASSSLRSGALAWCSTQGEARSDRDVMQRCSRLPSCSRLGQSSARRRSLIAREARATTSSRDLATVVTIRADRETPLGAQLQSAIGSPCCSLVPMRWDHAPRSTPIQ